MSQEKHVAVFSFPFGSHPRPLITLALKMATSAPQIQFSFFGTKQSNSSLLSSSNLEDQLPSNVKICHIEDGITVDLITSNFLQGMDQFFSVALENFTRGIQSSAAETGIKITGIVTDALLSWFACEIAENLNCSWIPIITGLPSCWCSYINSQIIYDRLADNPNVDQNQTLDFIPALSMLRVKDLPHSVLSKDYRKSVFGNKLLKIGQPLSKATAVAVSSFRELNPELLNSEFDSKFRDFLNLGIIAIRSSDSDQSGCISWLDRQSSKSVAYISFGTSLMIQDEELRSLAEALEHSKIRFLWSLKDEFIEKLPNGFIEKTNEQGKIVPWAPQLSVLSHDSIAVFISHAGYNAVRESILNGVPMICRPMFADQMMAGWLVEVEWKIGGTVEDGVISKNGLLDNLEMFLPVDNEKGKKMRENVQQLKNVVSMATQPGGSAAKDFNKLMEIIY